MDSGLRRNDGPENPDGADPSFAGMTTRGTLMAPTDHLDEATVAAWRLHDPALPENPDPRELARRLRGGSISRALRRRARSGGQRTIIGVDGEEVSLRQLHAQTEALAVQLGEVGVGPERPTLLAAPTSLDFIRCYLALLAVRSPVVLANPSATSPEFEAQIAAASVSVAITGGEATETLADLAAGEPLKHWPIAALATEGGGALAQEALPRSGDTAVCGFTSGTTGAPKMAPLRHGDVLASIRSAMRAWRWRRGDVLVHALPMFHQHGLGALHASILAGSSLHCLSRFDPERLVAEAKRRRASVIFAVPAMWERIVAAHTAVDAPGLRLAISGSAPLPATLFERVHDVLGMPPLERYGTTESGLNISNLYDGPRQPGGVGFPLPGVETKIDGETGELSVRGPQLFGGYAGGARIGPGEWFATGDQARADPDSGAVAITGRLKDIIITGGMNVLPREVEDTLARHPAVDAVAVVGVPSRRWGEEVTAFVVSASGFSEDELRRWTRSRLSGFKVPKRFHRIEEIPRNPTGKILRSDLRGPAPAAQQRAD
ncbi:MAG: AMP-binding protein [bacterium]|nr:AMP-binding protein [bacterium]